MNTATVTHPYENRIMTMTMTPTESGYELREVQ